MSVVFRGENLLDPRRLRAIKIIRPELAEQPEFTARFVEEASVLEGLLHPHVVRFYGLRRERDLLVMELELLEGTTLAKHIEDAPAPLSAERAIRWLAEASGAVAAAHAKGIVHRDLKPDNLFVTDAGSIKVLDFGIARALDEADRATKVTVAGLTVGTPAYMAPEVCEGALPSPAADVYALGLTFHEALLGHHPFAAPGEPRKSTTQLMFAHVSQALPALAVARPELPRALVALLERATAKDPAGRFASGEEMFAAAKEVGEEPPKGVHTEFALLPFVAGAPPAANASERSLSVPQTPVSRGDGSVGSARSTARRRPLVVGAALLVAAGAALLVRVGTRRPPSAEAQAITPSAAVAASADASASAVVSLPAPSISAPPAAPQVAPDASASALSGDSGASLEAAQKKKLAAEEARRRAAALEECVREKRQPCADACDRSLPSGLTCGFWPHRADDGGRNLEQVNADFAICKENERCKDACRERCRDL